LRAKHFALIAVISVFVFTAGCNKKPEYIPGSSVQGFRAPISKILFSPVAFDGATVAVEGIVTDVSTEPEQPGEDMVTNFKISDLNGNYINVYMPDTWEISENDYMIVGGVYRKNGNVIEAEEMEKIVLEKDNRKEEIEKRDDW
jgi:hypothetical protein